MMVGSLVNKKEALVFSVFVTIYCAIVPDYNEILILFLVVLVCDIHVIRIEAVNINEVGTFFFLLFKHMWIETVAIFSKSRLFIYGN